MGKDFIESLVTVITMVVVLAIVAVLVSKNASTGGVLTSGGNALSNVIRAAVSPIGTNASDTELSQAGHIPVPPWGS
jgi:PRD1 phage membrane DNA delivery